MNTRQERIDFHRNYCVHYNGSRGCTAGQNQEQIQCVPVDNNGKMIKWGPCIGGHTLENPSQFCPKWERQSQESGERYADAIEKTMKRMEVVDLVINVWRRKLPIGKAEVIECPACKGKLHLSQAPNGHIFAKCETADCVHFIE